MWHVLTRPLRSPVSVNPLEFKITAGVVRTEEFAHPRQCTVEARQRLRVGTGQSHPSQFGHSKISMTQDQYLGRKSAGREAADALDRASHIVTTEDDEGVSAG